MEIQLTDVLGYVENSTGKIGQYIKAGMSIEPDIKTLLLDLKATAAHLESALHNVSAAAPVTVVESAPATEAAPE